MRCPSNMFTYVFAASAKELSASYSAQLDSCPDGKLGTGLNTSTTAFKKTGGIPRERLRPRKRLDMSRRLFEPQSSTTETHLQGQKQRFKPEQLEISTHRMRGPVLPAY